MSSPLYCLFMAPNGAPLNSPYKLGSPCKMAAGRVGGEEIRSYLWRELGREEGWPSDTDRSFLSAGVFITLRFVR